MSKVIANGYIGVTTLSTDVLGASVSYDLEEDKINLRIGDRGWRISVEQGSGGLAHCGCAVANALSDLADDLNSPGFTFKEDRDLACNRGANGLISCQDPAGDALD